MTVPAGGQAERTRSDDSKLWELPEGALRVLLLVAAGNIEPDEARRTLKRGGFSNTDIAELLLLCTSEGR